MTSLATNNDRQLMEMFGFDEPATTPDADTDLMAMFGFDEPTTPEPMQIEQPAPMPTPQPAQPVQMPQQTTPEQPMQEEYYRHHQNWDLIRDAAKKQARDNAGPTPDPEYLRRFHGIEMASTDFKNPEIAAEFNKAYNEEQTQMIRDTARDDVLKNRMTIKKGDVPDNKFDTYKNEYLAQKARIDVARNEKSDARVAGKNQEERDKYLREFANAKIYDFARNAAILGKQPNEKDVKALVANNPEAFKNFSRFETDLLVDYYRSEFEKDRAIYDLAREFARGEIPARRMYEQVSELPKEKQGLFLSAVEKWVEAYNPEIAKRGTVSKTAETINRVATSMADNATTLLLDIVGGQDVMEFYNKAQAARRQGDIIDDGVGYQALATLYPMIISMLAGGAAGGGVAGMVAGGSVMATQEIPSLYNELLDMGVDKGTARGVAVVGGAAISALEYIGGGQPAAKGFNQTAKKAVGEAFRRFFTEGVKNYSGEMMEEALQGLATIAAKKVSTWITDQDVSYDVKEGIKQWATEMEQAGGPMALIMAPGMVGGGISSIANAKANSVTNFMETLPADAREALLDSARKGSLSRKDINEALGQPKGSPLPDAIASKESRDEIVRLTQIKEGPGEMPMEVNVKDAIMRDKEAQAQAEYQKGVQEGFTKLDQEAAMEEAGKAPAIEDAQAQIPAQAEAEVKKLEQNIEKIDTTQETIEPRKTEEKATPYKTADQMDDTEVDAGIRQHESGARSSLDYEDSGGVQEGDVKIKVPLGEFNKLPEKHRAGDALLQATVQAYRDAGFDVFHVGGPIFAVRGDGDAQAVADALAKQEVMGKQIGTVETGGDIELRDFGWGKKLSEMTPEERRQALTHTVVGKDANGKNILIQNRKAYRDRMEQIKSGTEKYSQAAFDMDRLGEINKVSAKSADFVKRKLTEIAVKELGNDVYLLGGDEFAVVGKDAVKIDAQLKKVADNAKKHKITMTGKDGVKYQAYPSFTAGLGRTYEQADKIAEQRKRSEKSAERRSGVLTTVEPVSKVGRRDKRDNNDRPVGQGDLQGNVVAWDTETPETFTLGEKSWDVRKIKRKLSKQKDLPIADFEVKKAKGVIDQIEIRKQKKGGDAPIIIERSTDQFGDVQDMVIDGWQRVSQALKSGKKTVPAVYVDTDGNVIDTTKEIKTEPAPEPQETPEQKLIRENEAEIRPVIDNIKKYQLIQRRKYNQEYQGAEGKKNFEAEIDGDVVMAAGIFVGEQEAETSAEKPKKGEAFSAYLKRYLERESKSAQRKIIEQGNAELPSETIVGQEATQAKDVEEKEQIEIIKKTINKATKALKPDVANNIVAYIVEKMSMAEITEIENAKRKTAGKKPITESAMRKRIQGGLKKLKNNAEVKGLADVGLAQLAATTPIEDRLYDAFPGAMVEKSAEGWTVTLPNNRKVEVRSVSNIPVNIDSIMSEYGVSRDTAIEMSKPGVAGVTVAQNLQFKLPDGKVITASEIMVFLDPAKMNQTTMRHEALHVAKELGLFDTKEGKRMWTSLMDEYGGEGAIAKARENWEGPRNLWQKIADFFDRFIARLGFKWKGIGWEAPEWSPSAAMSETFSQRFWAQGAEALEPGDFKYQLMDSHDAAVTSIKNDVVNELRRMREVGELEGVDPETQQQWLNEASDTLSQDPAAGERLVRELAKTPRVLSDRETAILQMYYRATYNRFDALSKELFAASDTGNEVQTAIAQAAVNEQLAILAKIEDATKSAGREWGRAGVARQITLAKDFSLVGMLRKARVANGGKALSKDQTAEIKVMAERIKTLEKRLAEESNKSEDLDKREKVQAQTQEDVAVVKRKKVQRKTVTETKKQSALNKMQELLRKKSALIGKEKAANFAKFQLAEGETESSGEANVDAEIYEVAKELAQIKVEEGVTSYVLFSNSLRAVFGEVTAEAEASFKAAWNDAAQESGATAPEFGATDVRAVTRYARSIQRQLVEAGMRDLDEIVDAVHAVLQESIPDITRRQTMDAMSGYGQFSPLSKDEIDQVVRDLNGQLQQLGKLDDMQKGEAPKKTGQERRIPTDEERRLIQQVNEAKKRGGFNAKSPEAQLKSALDAAKTAVKNRIADLTWEIQNKERIVRDRNELKADAELEALRKQRDALQAVHKEMFPAKKATQEQKIAAANKALDKAIADLEQQLEKGDIAPKAQAKPISTPELDAKRARLDALRAERKALRAAANPKMTPEERARRSYEANLRRRIADYKDRIALREFKPKKKTPRNLSASELRLKRKLEDVKAQFYEKAGQYHLANLSPGERVWDYARETMHLSRAAMTSIDLSAVYRQGGLVVYGHPMLAKEAGEAMLKAFVSKQAEFNSAEEIRNDPLGQFAITAKLGISEEDGRIEHQEEAYQGRWAKKVPGVAASGRAYTTFINNLRFILFKQMVTNLGHSGRVTLDEAKVLAKYINVATGRADFKALNKAAANLNMVFFAPRYVASRFQYIATPFILPFMKTSTRVKVAIAKEYARTITGWATTTGLLMAFFWLMAGDDDDEQPTLETNARSSDFMKIKIGESRIDTLAGLGQILVLSTRIATGEIKNSKGDITKLKKGYKPTTEWGLIGKFLRTKLAPIPGAAVTAADDFRNVVGEKETPLSLAGGLFIPLSIRDTADAMQQRGVPRGTALSILGLLGMSLNTYGQRTSYLAATEEERKELFEKDLNKIQWDDPSLPYSDRLTPEQLRKMEVAKKLDLGRQVYAATSLRPKRKVGQSLDEYKKSVAKWEERRDKAKEAMQGATGPEAVNAFRIYWAKRGGNVSSDSFQEKISRIGFALKKK